MQAGCLAPALQGPSRPVARRAISDFYSKETKAHPEVTGLSTPIFSSYGYYSPDRVLSYPLVTWHRSSDDTHLVESASARRFLQVEPKALTN